MKEDAKHKADEATCQRRRRVGNLIVRSQLSNKRMRARSQYANTVDTTVEKVALRVLEGIHHAMMDALSGAHAPKISRPPDQYCVLST